MRAKHVAQVAAILEDPAASPNDRYVALTLLKNAEIAARGILPMCQDTGTATIVGKKGQQVWTGANDAEWFCLDTGRAHDDGECPVLLFDPADNQLDQVFYDSFAAMVREVLEFVEDTLRGDGALRD